MWQQWWRFEHTSGQFRGSSGGTGSFGSSGGASNVLAITVNDPSYPNKPTVSVTVCTPGSTTNCQTINNILLDTGSYGLRIFGQVLTNVSLPQVTVGSGSLAECVAYMDGSGDWGPVQIADVVLGGETASNVPIQVIDATYFGTAIPAACKPPNVTSLDESPSSAGFNGILGVGLFASDCGPGCNSANNGIYYTCSGSSCVGTAVSPTSQVQNPVALLTQDNNGVIVQLPSVPLGGVPSVNGQLILGIGTESNNSPSGVTAYPAADSSGEFTTVFNGSTLSDSFIDSGSNGLFFNAPASLLPLCSSSSLGDGWYCAQPTQTLNATTEGYNGSPSGSVPFQIGDATNLFNTSNSVFVELGGPAPAGSGFDWGLPFFFGRSVFVGIDGTNSTLGSGPYWAY